MHHFFETNTTVDLFLICTNIELVQKYHHHEKIQMELVMCRKRNLFLCIHFHFVDSMDESVGEKIDFARISCVGSERGFS